MIFILHDKIVELCNLWLHIMMFCLMSMIISACIYYMKPSLPLMSTFSVEYRTILKSWSQANYDMYYQYVFPISRFSEYFDICLYPFLIKEIKNNIGFSFKNRYKYLPYIVQSLNKYLNVIFRWNRRRQNNLS